MDKWPQNTTKTSWGHQFENAIHNIPGHISKKLENKFSWGGGQNQPPSRTDRVKYIVTVSDLYLGSKDCQNEKSLDSVQWLEDLSMLYLNVWLYILVTVQLKLEFLNLPDISNWFLQESRGTSHFFKAFKPLIVVQLNSLVLVYTLRHLHVIIC